MRFLPIIGLLICTQGWAQSKLKGVQVKIQESGAYFEVSASYAVEIPEEVRTLKLKALGFQGASIEQIEVASENFEIEETQDLITLLVTPGQGLDTITMSYRVIPGKKGEIPLFFGEWQSTSSDQDFLQLQLTASRETNMLFPAENEVTLESTFKEIRASIPAATSMIRVEQGANKGSQWMQRVDQFVIGLFLVIGILIWFNRKRLIYE